MIDIEHSTQISVSLSTIFFFLAGASYINWLIMLRMFTPHEMLYLSKKERNQLHPQLSRSKVWQYFDKRVMF